MRFATAARDVGYRVSVLTRLSEHRMRIKSEGMEVIPIQLSRQDLKPTHEIRLLRQLIKIYREQRPDIVHHVAMKPIIYGSLASKMSGVDAIVNSVAGLGYVFSSDERKARYLRPIIRKAFKFLKSNLQCHFLFQNPDDAHLLFPENTRKGNGVTVIKGVGVDTELFVPRPETGGVPIITLAARLIWEKGIEEFVCASRKLREKGVVARFVIVGEPDDRNPSAISRAQLAGWVEEGVIEWSGYRDDMPAVINESHVVCLPSYYREGLPTILIEAAACGRPIVTTDAPGCREIVRDGENGFLVPIRDANALAVALRRLIESPALRSAMGARGREIVEREFTQEQVIQETLALYEELLR